MIQPINRTVANDYRQSLGVADAPQMIDTEVPITPVLLVNNSFPKPSTSQKLRWAYIAVTGVGNYQIATVKPSTKIYYIAAYATATSATLCGIELFDGTAGAAPSPAADTLVFDQSASLARFLTAAIGATQSNNPTLPIQLKQGLRIDAQSVGVNVRVIIYWIEETSN